eukprot:5306544-Pyramimonas_sp.AAC.1
MVVAWARGTMTHFRSSQKIAWGSTFHAGDRLRTLSRAEQDAATAATRPLEFGARGPLQGSMAAA